jgi:hypothetical protein
MPYANGRFPQSALAPITKAANGQQAYLRKDAARAFMAMNADSERRFGVTLRATSARCAYRPIADQNYFWNLYVSGRGSLAARPGSSNHGLAITVDFATPQMRHIVDLIGAKYGWAKRWSDAPSEWWHVRWDARYVTVNLSAPDPLAHMTAEERSKVREWQQLKAHGTNKKRRGELFRWMIARRKNIYRAAQKSGWSKANRKSRYATLYKLTRP